MSKLTRKHKVNMARRMMTSAELRANVSIWLSKAWLERKAAVAIRVLKREGK